MDRGAAVRRAAWFPLLLAAAILTSVAPSLAPADGERGSSGAAVAATADPDALAQSIARPSPDLQLPSGAFRDYVWEDRDGLGARYGESMLGYGLLLRGIRTGERRLVDSGLRALDAVVEDRRRATEPSVFENLAVAASYNLALRSAKDDPLFANVRHEWESWLRKVRVLHLARLDSFANKQLVEAVALLELLRTGVRSSDPRTVLGNRSAVRRLVQDFIDRRVPRLVAGTAVAVDGEQTLVFSDPRSEPLAYHALSMGFLARAIELLGARATAAPRRVLREAALASWRLASPSGDVSYVGRSQEQAWTLPFTAYGAASAAALPGAAAADRSRLEALAERVLERLRSRYSVGPAGLWITPALAIDEEGGRRALDVYAGATAYTGLTLVALDWAAARLRGRPLRAGRLAADAPHAARLSLGEGSCVVVRTASTWFAVKRAPSFAEFPGDLRYDFGLVTLERRVGDRWSTVVPLRPRTKRSRHDSAGPILLEGARRGLPYGTRMSATTDGAVRIRGGFRTAGGAWLRRGVVFRFQPDGDGVRLTFPARAGDRFEYSGFFVENDPGPRSDRRSVSDARERLAFSVPQVTAPLQRGYSSGADPRLVRTRSRLTAPRSGPVTVWAGPA